MLKKTIEEGVYFAFRRAQAEALNQDRSHELHVTDTVSPCLRKTIYGKINPISIDTESMSHLYMGQAVHGLSQLSPDLHEVPLAYDWVEDKPVDLSKLDLKLDDPKWWDIIIGAVDDVIKIDDEYIICDKKTTNMQKWKPKTPNEAHQKQINIYRLLLNKCKGIDSKHGCILYLDVTDKIQKPLPLSFGLNPIEETLETLKKDATIIKNAMVNGVLPERTQCYLCDGYCSYSMTCFTDNRTHWRE